MKPRRGWLFWLVLVWIGVCCGCAGTGGETAAADFLRLDPSQPVATGDKIEVTEFFSYACPHCFALSPRVKSWVENKAADVAFRYQPVIFRASWDVPARIYFALAMLGEAERIGYGVFDAIQLEQLDFSDDQVLFDWVARQGVDRQRFADAYRSPGVQAEVAGAPEVAQAYQVHGVPAFVVDGKYLTSNSLTGSAQGTIDALDRLVERARQERVKRN